MFTNVITFYTHDIIKYLFLNHERHRDFIFPVNFFSSTSLNLFNRHAKNLRHILPAIIHSPPLLHLSQINRERANISRR